MYALAVLRNHLHAVIRTHRDDSIDMLIHIANASHEALLNESIVPRDQPVWSDRPYKVNLRSENHIRTCINYVNANPQKLRLHSQVWFGITTI